MADNNYPTPGQRTSWEDFQSRVYLAHPTPGKAAEKIAAWEAARGTAGEAEAAAGAVTPAQ